jgi:hypothetical protein
VRRDASTATSTAWLPPTKALTSFKASRIRLRRKSR